MQTDPVTSSRTGKLESDRLTHQDPKSLYLVAKNIMKHKEKCEELIGPAMLHQDLVNLFLYRMMSLGSITCLQTSFGFFCFILMSRFEYS